MAKNPEVVRIVSEAEQRDPKAPVAPMITGRLGEVDVTDPYISCDRKDGQTNRSDEQKAEVLRRLAELGL